MLRTTILPNVVPIVLGSVDEDDRISPRVGRLFDPDFTALLSLFDVSSYARTHASVQVGWSGWTTTLWRGTARSAPLRSCSPPRTKIFILRSLPHDHPDVAWSKNNTLSNVLEKLVICLETFRISFLVFFPKNKETTSSHMCSDVTPESLILIDSARTW